MITSSWDWSIQNGRQSDARRLDIGKYEQEREKTGR